MIDYSKLNNDFGFKVVEELVVNDLIIMDEKGYLTELHVTFIDHRTNDTYIKTDDKKSFLIKNGSVAHYCKEYDFCLYLSKEYCYHFQCINK